MTRNKNKKGQFRRMRKFKTVNEMVDFIERNNIRNFNSVFCEYKKEFVLYY